LVGIGADLGAGKAAENLGGRLFSALADTNAKRGWLLDHKLDETVLADICFGAELASYHFDQYFTDNKSDDLQELCDEFNDDFEDEDLRLFRLYFYCKVAF